METSTNMATPRSTVVLLLFFFVPLSFLVSLSSCADPVYLYHICGDNTTLFASNSTYQSNLNTLLSSLSSNATSNSNNAFRNATIGRSPNTVYGLYFCRGDVTRDLCRDCVNTSSADVVQRCPNTKIAYIWYDECTLYYSNRSIFSTVTDSPAVYMWNTANISDPTGFNQLLGDTMNKAATVAASDSERFATEEANFTRFQTMYCLAQCSPDLSVNDCNRCLVGVIGGLPYCCSGKQGGRVLNPSCNIRYELYPFYQQTVSATAPSGTRVVFLPPPPPPPPPSKSSYRDTPPGELLRLVGVHLII